MFYNEVAIWLRKSEFIDEKSGVSARLSITALENLYSTAELRLIKNEDAQTSIRVSDFMGIIPSITGKIDWIVPFSPTLIAISASIARLQNWLAFNSTPLS